MVLLMVVSSYLDCICTGCSLSSASALCSCFAILTFRVTQSFITPQSKSNSSRKSFCCSRACLGHKLGSANGADAWIESPRLCVFAVSKVRTHLTNLVWIWFLSDALVIFFASLIDRCFAFLVLLQSFARFHCIWIGRIGKGAYTQ